MTRFSVCGWIADPSTGMLIQDCRSVRLEPRTMSVLLRLAEAAGSVVTKRALIDEVWGGRIVSDHSLSIVISHLRRALGDKSAIETITKRGYRLLAPVRWLEEPSPVPRFWVPRLVPHLSRVAGALVAVLLATLLMTLASDSRAAHHHERVFAVVSFDNASGDPRHDGMAMLLPNAIASRMVERGLPVLRWEVADTADRERTIERMVSWRPGVHLITGTIMTDGPRTLVSVQLTDTHDCTTAWVGMADLGQGAHLAARKLATELAQDHNQSG